MPDAFDVEPTLRVDAPKWFRDALAMPFEQASIEVHGAEVNYLTWGAPTSTGLVFVHGGGAHAHWWTHIAASFAPWMRCVALDLTGHGDSGRRESYSLETWTDEVVAVAGAAGIGTPVVIGHSMGGMVTIATAARHPDFTAGAVIVDSPVAHEDPEVAAARIKSSFGTPRLHTDLDEVLARFRTVPPQANYLDYVIDHVARRSLLQVDGGWMWKFDANFWHGMGGSPRTSALPYLSQIESRVALIRCEDGLVDTEIGRFMYAEMGRRTPVVELPTAGHHPMLDVPLILITAIRALLADWLHSDPHAPR